MQQGDGFLPDDEKEKLEIRPKIVRTQRKVRINGKDKRSLVTQCRQEWPETEDGVFASWQAAANAQSDRDRVFELLEIHERDTAAIIECELSVHAAGDMGSLLSSAKKYAAQTTRVRRSIEHFEKYEKDAGDLSRFYDAMRTTLELAGDLELLTIKRHEKAILRGSDDSFDGRGITQSEKRKAVERIVRLQNEGLGKTAAVERVRKEIGRGKSTVFGWIKEIQKK